MIDTDFILLVTSSCFSSACVLQCSHRVVNEPSIICANWKQKLRLSLPKVLVCVLVAQSCLTLCDSMDCSRPGSSVHRSL